MSAVAAGLCVFWRFDKRDALIHEVGFCNQSKYISITGAGYYLTVFVLLAVISLDLS